MRASLTSAFLALALPSLTAAQVLDVRELNTEHIRARQHQWLEGKARP
jgi:hypothetical protein